MLYATLQVPVTKAWRVQPILLLNVHTECLGLGLIFCYELTTKKDMKFGTWNVRSLYRTGSVTAAVRELARYKLDLVCVQEVKWDKGHMQSTCNVYWSLYTGTIEAHLFYVFCGFYGLLNFHFEANKNLLFDTEFCEVPFDCSMIVFTCSRISKFHRVGVLLTSLN